MIENKGVILGNRESDWIAGSNSQIEYKIENPSGNWTDYLPQEEWQYDPIGFDTMACVTFSALSILETLYSFKTGTKRNFSDRFTATLSGTLPTGNYLWRVGDSIRKDGLVDESDWPMIDNPKWDTYYTMPPIGIINKAKEFLKEWQVQYEVIDFSRESLLKHILQAPIQVVFPNHAVMLFSTTEQIYKYFDSYSPFVKERSGSFIFAQKYILNKKTMYTLFKGTNGEIYAQGNGYIRHIANLYTLRKGQGREWADFGSNEDNIPQGGMAFPEAEEIAFLPNDSMV